MILSRRKNVMKYREAQMTRRRLIEECGIDPWLVSATATNNLAALERDCAVQLTLVPDADQPTPAERMFADGCTPDEVASVYTFATSKFHEAPSLGGGWFPQGAA